MSPVQPSSGHATKALLLALVAVLVAIGVLYGASVLLTNRHNSQIREGAVGGVVTVGKVSQLAKHVNGDNQPTFYPDISGNKLRDLWVQHVGSDLKTGWVVFAAQVPDEPDGCAWAWQRNQRRFEATCDRSKVLAADAPGLYHYPVTVKGGKLRVDLSVTPGQVPTGPPG
ncbi:MAG: hypothetical protein ABI276_04100 [Acidimicrobiales bacterium]